MIPEEKARKLKLRGSDTFLRSHLAYKDETNCISYSAFLHCESYTAFRKSIMVSHAKEIEAESKQGQLAAGYWVKTDITPHLEQPFKMQALREYYLENLLIGSAFELYFKAILVEKGVVVHVIDEDIPIFKPLAKQQKKRPIYAHELLAIEGFMYDKEANINRLRGLTSQSINFGTILEKKKYTSLLDKSDQIIEIANYYRLSRNQIHMPGDYTGLNLPFDENVDGPFTSYLIGFINSDIVHHHNTVAAPERPWLGRLLPIERTWATSSIILADG